MSFLTGPQYDHGPPHLLPVAFHEHITSMPVNPTVAHPNCMGTWRALPTARCPNVRISVPLMIATDPHKAWTRRGDSPLNNLPGRMDLHDDFLGMKRTNTHRYREQRGRQKSTHIHSPFTAPTPTGRFRSSECFNAQHAEAINKNTLQCFKECRDGGKSISTLSRWESNRTHCGTLAYPRRLEDQDVKEKQIAARVAGSGLDAGIDCG